MDSMTSPIMSRNDSFIYNIKRDTQGYKDFIQSFGKTNRSLRRAQDQHEK